jgi:hypothetical protein
MQPVSRESPLVRRWEQSAPATFWYRFKFYQRFLTRTSGAPIPTAFLPCDLALCAHVNSLIKMMMTERFTNRRNELPGGGSRPLTRRADRPWAPAAHAPTSTRHGSLPDGVYVSRTVATRGRMVSGTVSALCVGSQMLWNRW